MEVKVNGAKLKEAIAKFGSLQDVIAALEKQKSELKIENRQIEADIRHKKEELEQL